MENTKSKDKALLLAFFLGMFGAHRFYINKKIQLEDEGKGEWGRV